MKSVSVLAAKRYPLELTASKCDTFFVYHPSIMLHVHV